MTPKWVYPILFSIIVLLIVSVLLIPSSSQTCSSCPDGACPINCGETITNRETTISEYFYFTLTSDSDVNITMTPNSTVNYDLYVTWSPNVCPNEANKDCKPGEGTGVQEICQNSNLSTGTYYARVRWYDGDGKFNISLSCSESPTTTTSSTTTTTTTLPTVSLQCERDEIYVKQKNACNVTNCEDGYWLIKNLENKPLENETIQEIPPNEIEFGPTIKEGRVSTEVVCLNPSQTLNHTTLVKKGPVLVCPNTCYLDESCKCEVEECEDGLFLMDNYDGDPLTGDVIKDVDDVQFVYNFYPQDVGKIRARMICHDPYEIEDEFYINISYPVTTTTLPGEFDVSKKTLNKDEIMMEIGKNARTEDTLLYVQLIKEPEGIIYYTGTVYVRSGFEGDKTLSLTEIKDCPEETNLKLLVLAYSSKLQRVDRLKDVAFEC